MTSVESTAYPRFRRLIQARELHTFFTPEAEEIRWAKEKSDTDEHLLALVVALKCAQRLTRFPRRAEIPQVVVEHVRDCLELPTHVAAGYASDRTERQHRGWIRERIELRHQPAEARALARAEISRAALVKNNPHDLINVAVERLAHEGLELPGFSTLAKIASKVRGEVNAQLFRRVWQRIAPMERLRLQHLLMAIGPDGRSGLDRLKKPARRATWSRFREQVEHLAWVDGLGRTEEWLQDVAPTKIGDFAGECAAQDAASLRDYGQVKRVVLLACLVHEARQRARDDLAEMLCKRVARNIKRAKAELEEIRLRQRALTESLVGNYRAVLEQLGPDGPTAAAQQAAQELARAVGALEPAATGDAADPAAVMAKQEPPPVQGADSMSANGPDRPDHGRPAAVLALMKALRVQAAGIAAARSPIERAGGFAAQPGGDRAGLGHSRRQLRDAGAALLQKGPAGHVRPGQPLTSGGHLAGRQRARGAGPHQAA